jgi:hypothetical protein
MCAKIGEKAIEDGVWFILEFHQFCTQIEALCTEVF